MTDRAVTTIVIALGVIAFVFIPERVDLRAFAHAIASYFGALIGIGALGLIVALALSKPLRRKP